MKPFATLLACLCLSIGAMAQKFDLPTNIKLESPEDYASYEQDILKAVNWLEKTPLGEQDNKRKDVASFLQRWLTGAPNVTLEINADIATFTEECPDCMVIFMGGWAVHALENKDSETVNGNVAGLESVLEFYDSNKELLGKIKSLDKYTKVQSKGDLKSHIESQLKT